MSGGNNENDLKSKTMPWTFIAGTDHENPPNTRNCTCWIKHKNVNA